MTRHAHLIMLALTVVALCSFFVGCSGQKSDPTAGVVQETFATPEDAAYTLIDTARKGNLDLMVPIFGPGILGMEAESRERTDGDLQRIAAAYDRKHVLVMNEDGSVSLLAGELDWEFPAPIVKQNGRWRFDTEAGLVEIQNRRIERNEDSALGFCLDCVDLQKQFFAMSSARGESTPTFAANFRSSAGKRDGLYWPDHMGEPTSPLGPIAAEAFASGELKKDVDARQPYKGYWYRILTSQGPGAPGGAKNYIDSQGRLTGGFAIIAYPAEYGNSGIMSFMVSADGIGYSKDLGPDSTALGEAMSSFDPTGWDTAAP